MSTSGFKKTNTIRRLFRKEEILTIPNLLSLVRLMLIPVIIWFYCVAENYPVSVAVVILSGITDIADGIIARSFGMVSDFGKILDPIADKLTQAALLLCLSVRHPLMLALVLLFVLREGCMLFMGYITLKRFGEVNSAKWYGKLSTVVLYATMVLLILLPGISSPTANTLICLCGGVIFFSFFMYARFYIRLWLGKISPEYEDMETRDE